MTQAWAYRCQQPSKQTCRRPLIGRLFRQAARSLRKGSGGGAKAHRGLLQRFTGFRVRTLAQLVHWGAGMAATGLLLVVLLESTRGDPRVANFSDYMQVGTAFTSHFLTGSIDGIISWLVTCWHHRNGGVNACV